MLCSHAAPRGVSANLSLTRGRRSLQSRARPHRPSQSDRRRTPHRVRVAQLSHGPWSTRSVSHVRRPPRSFPVGPTRRSTPSGASAFNLRALLH